VAAYREAAERARAAGIGAVFVATTPWRKEAALQPGYDELNRLLREAFPADRIVDFDSGFDDPALLMDTVHHNEAGQRKRGQRAYEAITRSP
jgi:hypothetical protein